jgi:hypothetical protein
MSERYTTARVPAARPSGIARSNEPYTCPELQRTCMRPGAYDIVGRPSLIGNKLHYPDGRIEPREGATS